MTDVPGAPVVTARAPLTAGPTSTAALASAEATAFRELLARALAALEAADAGGDPVDAVPDLPGLLAEVRRAVAAAPRPA